MAEENFTEDTSDEQGILEEEKFDVFYECLRCNVQVNLIELNRLPEIKCICGFRVFTKIRPPIVKTVKAV
jgi:DNA-directed RNA polymerase subunit P|tara:strand:- start:2678 stop:2887 length:210 start_codon:yes stop_codon:yes gene_type:complete